MIYFPLPLECLQLILQQLADERACLTLSNLLRVNRYVCYATLPYLYSDPFQDSLYQGFRRPFRLACTLLRQAPPERISDLLRIVVLEWVEREDKKTLFPDDNKAFNILDTLSIIDSEDYSKVYIPVINYLPYIQQLDYHGFYFARAIRDLLDDKCPEHTASCIQRLNLAEEYRADFVYLITRGWYRPDESENHTLETMQMDLLRDMLFAFCHLESVRSLTIPLSDIGRYLGVVDRLKSLSMVRFIIDVHLIISESSGESTENTKHHHNVKHHGVSTLEDIVSFVKKHTVTHKNVLKYAFCHETPAHYTFQQPCPDEYRLRVLECLPPLQSPRVLNSKNWLQFVVGSEEMDLGSVELFDGDRRWRDRLPLNGVFLSRCRSLKRIHTGSYGRVSYQWAVEEKKQRFAGIERGMSPKQLVPVQIIETTSEPDSLRYDIRDASYAFSDTLEKLVANSPPFNFVPEAFKGCQALQTALLEDRITEYTTQDIQTCLPAELPHLTNLTLVGTPAVSFHPDTLHSTSKLEYLDLRISRDYSYIPPVEELQSASRPVWSWDWHLPNLRAITLSAEFAYRFQFRMLHGCPNLESLWLDLRTRTGGHERVLHSTDLTSAHIEQPGKDSQQQCHPHLPKLCHLDIMGRWEFEDDFLRTLLQRVGPNVLRVNLEGCSGYGIRELIDASRWMRELNYCESPLEVDAVAVEEAKAAGLVEYVSGKAGSKQFTHFRFHNIHLYRIHARA
ncbi:hypothetical protein BGX28_002820 [Mortierella sp. GBA30]|nr:hypothetical protein BGX28_002820 [Mortierella sp. GBA30]